MDKKEKNVFTKFISVLQFSLKLLIQSILFFHFKVKTKGTSLDKPPMSQFFQFSLIVYFISNYQTHQESLKNRRLHKNIKCWWNGGINIILSDVIVLVFKVKLHWNKKFLTIYFDPLFIQIGGLELVHCLKIFSDKKFLTCLLFLSVQGGGNNKQRDI